MYAAVQHVTNCREVVAEGKCFLLLCSILGFVP